MLSLCNTCSNQAVIPWLVWIEARVKQRLGGQLGYQVQVAWSTVSSLGNSVLVLFGSTVDPCDVFLMPSVTPQYPHNRGIGCPSSDFFASSDSKGEGFFLLLKTGLVAILVALRSKQTIAGLVEGVRKLSDFKKVIVILGVPYSSMQ